jgi:hypothetical protein
VVQWVDHGSANFSTQEWRTPTEDTSRSPSPIADPTKVRERDALGEQPPSEALFLHLIVFLALTAMWWWCLTRTKQNHWLIRLMTTLTLPLMTTAWAVSWFWQLGLGAELRGVSFETIDPHIGGVVLLTAAWWWSHTKEKWHHWFVRLMARIAFRACTVILVVSWGWQGGHGSPGRCSGVNGQKWETHQT